MRSTELEAALRIAEASWAAHLYLGWALLEQDQAKAEPHFQRALEIDEQKAARAHLALARLAEAKGQRMVALSHLDAYLAVSAQRRRCGSYPKASCAPEIAGLSQNELTRAEQNKSGRGSVPSAAWGREFN